MKIPSIATDPKHISPGWDAHRRWQATKDNLKFEFVSLKQRNLVPTCPMSILCTWQVTLHFCPNKATRLSPSLLSPGKLRSLSLNFLLFSLKCLEEYVPWVNCSKNYIAQIFGIFTSASAWALRTDTLRLALSGSSLLHSSVFLGFLLKKLNKEVCFFPSPSFSSSSSSESETSRGFLGRESTWKPKSEEIQFN